MISDAHRLLREATQAAHAQLEERIDIHRRIADLSGRRRLARGYWRLHAEVEAAAAPWLEALAGLDFAARRRSALIARELAALGGEPPAEAEMASPTASSRAEALGLLYVLEGSTLGGRMIRRQVAAGGGDFTGLGFLDPYGDAAGDRWRAFLSVLAVEAGEGPAIAAAVCGALTGFRHAEARLCEEPSHV
ncbi:biliverdin-producing heme oxygenase [Phenylobacterium soli]|uniref:Biliverdin-producing heme oxygenase n=1 Tax=Phenylobacterium soli TaxID=2170551 RepID=A0A328AKQ4_9CAUL|nr:biliverdin-producing heme oxygenase [Phenylobacterium soli]RAK54616.1 biliverdin-producing heme oxygenase [Phenylobacterium soli]